jgi:hypothetical protein
MDLKNWDLLYSVLKILICQIVRGQQGTQMFAFIAIIFSRETPNRNAFLLQKIARYMVHGMWILPVVVFVKKVVTNVQMMWRAHHAVKNFIWKELSVWLIVERNTLKMEQCALHATIVALLALEMVPISV